MSYKCIVTSEQGEDVKEFSVPNSSLGDVLKQFPDFTDDDISAAVIEDIDGDPKFSTSTKISEVEERTLKIVVEGKPLYYLTFQA